MTDSSEPSPSIADTAWVVFACSHCGHSVKVRAHEAGGVYQCPSCSQELTMPEASSPAPYSSTLPESHLFGETNPAAFDAEAPAQLQPQLAVDRLGATSFRSISDPSLAIPEEGIRVRKRKRRSSSAQAADQAPEWESETAADPAAPHEKEWEEVTSTTISQEVAEDGSVIEQRKRTKKKRLPPLVEKIWRVLTRAGTGALIALGLFVLVGAAAAGWYLARSQAPVITQAVEVEAFPERFFPTMDEGAQAAELVKTFLATDTIEKKLPLVRFPEKVLPLMDLWYKGRPDTAIAAARDELAESLTKIIYVDGAKFIVVTLLVEPDDEYKIYAVEATPTEGLKVDWETAVGWQAMTVEEFIKGKPTTPQPFRVQAAPGDYYNGHYADENKWFAVNLTYPGNADFLLYGYVERDSPAGRQLLRLLGYTESTDVDGSSKWSPVMAQSTPLILSLAYLVDGNADPKQVTIHEVLHEQWFLRNGPAAGSARKTGANE